MYIKCITRIILSIIIYVTKNWGWLEFSKFSQHNGKLPLPRWKQVNYPVIPIYAHRAVYNFPKTGPTPGDCTVKSATAAGVTFVSWRNLHVYGINTTLPDSSMCWTTPQTFPPINPFVLEATLSWFPTDLNQL